MKKVAVRFFIASNLLLLLMQAQQAPGYAKLQEAVASDEWRVASEPAPQVKSPRTNLVASPRIALPQGGSAWVVTFTANYVGEIICATPTSNDCLRGFEYWEYDGAGVAQKQISIANPAGASGSSVTVSAPLTSTRGYGNKTGYVVAVAADAQGARIEGPAASLSYHRKPNPVTGPKVEVQ